jgi:plasmid maintenance system antidote protein VapI
MTVEDGRDRGVTMAQRRVPLSLSDQLRQRIRQWTEENQCSLDDLATQAGINRCILYRFVAGERGINLDTADRLARVLRFRLADDR